jgi:hypothetical protein
MFSEAYDKCYDKVSFMAAWLLCWPMKLTFICNIMEGKQLTLLCSMIHPDEAPNSKVQTPQYVAFHFRKGTLHKEASNCLEKK